MCSLFWDYVCSIFLFYFIFLTLFVLDTKAQLTYNQEPLCLKCVSIMLDYMYTILLLHVQDLFFYNKELKISFYFLYMDGARHYFYFRICVFLGRQGIQSHCKLRFLVVTGV